MKKEGYRSFRLWANNIIDVRYSKTAYVFFLVGFLYISPIKALCTLQHRLYGAGQKGTGAQSAAVQGLCLTPY